MEKSHTDKRYRVEITDQKTGEVISRFFHDNVAVGREYDIALQRNKRFPCFYETVRTGKSRATIKAWDNWPFPDVDDQLTVLNRNNLFSDLPKPEHEDD